MRAILLLACLSCAEAIPSSQAKEAISSALLGSKPTTAFTPSTSIFGRLATPVKRNAGQLAMQAKNFDVRELAGVTEPLGFWDPLGFSEGKPDGRIRFYREVELKHGRISMLAALGFLVGEQYHPLFGGGVDSPAYRAFQETPLQTFWPFVVSAIAIPEIYSVYTFEDPATSKSLAKGEQWLIRDDHEPGDFDFDPLGLKPESPEELKEMQTKELNNGRLAMIGIAGMIVQELVSGEKLF